MDQQFEYASVEWLWDSGNIRINLPNGEEHQSTGTYAEIVATLNEMGQNGWDIGSCAAQSNWIYWTMKRAR
ncbi:hypothetical protein BKI52_42165 [marine bacterium AO1-C]|nr:hypothetical protein BKI52_42165 [marine bacterium AO1-C]